MLKKELRLLLLLREVGISPLHPDCHLFHRFPFSLLETSSKARVIV